MGAEITLHGSSVNSVFELLGSKENDITCSLGWALSQCGHFCQSLLRRLFPKTAGIEVEVVQLQEHKPGSGITDIELHGADLHVIIEAKRGWCLPSRSQLERYAARFQKAPCRQALVTMSECSRDYAKLHLPPEAKGVAVQHFSWNDIHRLARVPDGTHAEKRLLRQFRAYLERVVKMQDQESNLVYVVSLGSGRPDWSKVSWQDFVNKDRRYYHPVGGSGWPKQPPNYLGFRYGGRLQTIHHVEDWKIVEDMDAEVPEISSGRLWSPHFLYKLGKPIRPGKTVKTGRIYRNGRVWAMLDLLLTCKTIAEARDKTKARRKEG